MFPFHILISAADRKSVQTFEKSRNSFESEIAIAQISVAFLPSNSYLMRRSSPESAKRIDDLATNPLGFGRCAWDGEIEA